MKRREFITLLGGAVAWPLAARAQQAGMRRIGVLINLASDDPEAQSRIAAFMQGLEKTGWSIGRNVQIDLRWARRAGPSLFESTSWNSAPTSSRSCTRRTSPNPRCSSRMVMRTHIINGANSFEKSSPSNCRI
jgi:hypothetical protein